MTRRSVYPRWGYHLVALLLMGSGIVAGDDIKSIEQFQQLLQAENRTVATNLRLVTGLNQQLEKMRWRDKPLSSDLDLIKALFLKPKALLKFCQKEASKAWAAAKKKSGQEDKDIYVSYTAELQRLQESAEDLISVQKSWPKRDWASALVVFDAIQVKNKEQILKERKEWAELFRAQEDRERADMIRLNLLVRNGIAESGTELRMRLSRISDTGARVRIVKSYASLISRSNRGHEAALLDLGVCLREKHIEQYDSWLKRLSKQLKDAPDSDQKRPMIESVKRCEGILAELRKANFADGVDKIPLSDPRVRDLKSTKALERMQRGVKDEKAPLKDRIGVLFGFLDAVAKRAQEQQALSLTLDDALDHDNLRAMIGWCNLILATYKSSPTLRKDSRASEMKVLVDAKKLFEYCLKNANADLQHKEDEVAAAKQLEQLTANQRKELQSILLDLEQKCRKMDLVLFFKDHSKRYLDSPQFKREQLVKWLQDGEKEDPDTKNFFAGWFLSARKESKWYFSRDTNEYLAVFRAGKPAHTMVLTLSKLESGKWVFSRAMYDKRLKDSVKFDISMPEL